MWHASKLFGYALLSLLAIVVAIGVSHASNWPFLKESPLAKFNDEDVRLLREAAIAVVSDSTGPAKRRWENEKTGHHGELQTSSMFAGPNGIRCRRLRVVNYAGTRESKSTYTLCEMPPDGWRLVPSDFAPPPNRKKS